MNCSWDPACYPLLRLTRLLIEGAPLAVHEAPAGESEESVPSSGRTLAVLLSIAAAVVVAYLASR